LLIACICKGSREIADTLKALPRVRRERPLQDISESTRKKKLLMLARGRHSHAGRRACQEIEEYKRQGIDI
jgi:hypothetical protein